MGRKQTVELAEGQEFGRLVVQELGYASTGSETHEFRKGAKRAARVLCTGPHEPVEKWVQVYTLTSGAVRSCGCLNRESAAQRARERNADGSPRLGTGKKGLPPGVKYIPKGPQWRLEDDGRECAYDGEGGCGHAFKSWSEFNGGNGARGRSSWCRACQASHHQAIPLEDRRRNSLASRLRAFGLTVEQYRSLEAVHGGRCWLCREFETLTNEDGSPRRLGVDHDHSCCDFDPTPQHPLCGRCNRGLCCARCNRRVLGHVDSVGLDKVVRYLSSAQELAQALLSR